jgi:hypothetical protein
MNDAFNVNIHCVVLTTNIPLNKKYVLSLNENQIVLPSFGLKPDHVLDKNKFEDKIITFLKEYIFVSDIELFPQLISLNSANIDAEPNQLNVIYGFLVNYSNSLNNCYWTEFDYLSPTEHTPLLIEVIQKLQ